jgi:hypothetical protein
MKCVDQGEKASFEFVVWTTSVYHHSLRIIAIYRPPYSEVHPVTKSVFLQEFAEYLETIAMCHEFLIITGDFNFHMDQALDSHTIKLNELLTTFGLIQHVDIPTHILNHTLDLVITRDINDTEVTCSQPKSTLLLSDHHFVEWMINISGPPLTVKDVTYRKVKSINLDSFSCDLAASDLCTQKWTNLEQLCQSYQDTLISILDEHAPLKRVTMIVRPKVPWFTDNLKVMKAACKKAERKYMESRSPSDKEEMRKITNKYSASLEMTRKQYFCNSIDQCEGDSKKLFKIVNMCNGKQIDVLPPHSN